MHLMHRIPSLPTHPGIPPRGAEKSSDTAATVRFQDLLRRLRPNRLGGGAAATVPGSKTGAFHRSQRGASIVQRSQSLVEIGWNRRCLGLEE